MDKNEIEALSTLFNRSYNQTLFLLNLVENDINVLIELETKIKENFIHYCPASINSINKILNFEFKKDFDVEKNRKNMVIKE